MRLHTGVNSAPARTKNDHGADISVAMDLEVAAWDHRTMATGVVGREEQASAIADFLASIVAEPLGLVLEGEPGIGKTTLWLEAVRQAEDRGFRVMMARPVAAESVLAYASLADMLDDCDQALLADLPSPQRAALDRVLLREGAEGLPVDQRAVAAGFLSVVSALAEKSKVVLAIDDVQWLDSSSRLAVAFAVRRLTGPVGMLATIRTGENAAVGSWLQLPRPDAVRRIAMPPMSVGALYAVLADRLGRSFTRPAIVRIGELSGGNPFYALELARAAGDRPLSADISLSDGLNDLIRSKIRSAASDIGDVLLAVACLAEPTVQLVGRALGWHSDTVVALLEWAEDRELVEIGGGQLRFSHPLFARGVYDDATPERRRAMHRRLADVVDEPELRARHMALASTTGDPATLVALDAAAESARSRGAPAAAAELIDLAMGLGGDTPERRIAAAGHHFSAGDSARARTLLEHTIDGLAPGVLRAQAAGLLGYVRLLDDSFPQAAELLEGALAEAADAPPVLVPMLVTLSFALFNTGRLDEAVQRAEDAVAHAERFGRRDLLSQALSMRAMVLLLRGDGLDEAGMRRALELEDRQANTPIALRPTVHNAIMRSCTGELDWAHAELTTLRKRCIEHGEDGELMLASFHGTLVQVWRGRFADAALIVEDTVALAQQLGGDLPLSVALTSRCLVSAYLGRVDDARADVAAAREASRRCGSTRLGEWPATVLGFVEVSVGNYRAALDAVEPLVMSLASAPNATEIIAASFVPDAVEAMVQLDQRELAEPLVSALERNGTRLQRDWMLAIGARCRGLLSAARGDLTEAVAAVERAMEVHQRLPMPFERARTQLLLGQLQRRLRLRDVSAATLADALTAFERLGTPLWADRARAELGRTEVGARRRPSLSASEQRVAELAASGMTNRTIAAAMFISPKTVEATLARVYAKLGIRSRAELGRRIGEAANGRSGEHPTRR